MTHTLIGIAVAAGLVGIAFLRGSRPYEETFEVRGSPEEWLQRCYDALEGEPHFSEVKVSDEPLQVLARYRRRPGVWGRLVVTLENEGASTRIEARASVVPTPITAVRRPEPQIVGRLTTQLAPYLSTTRVRKGGS